MTLPNGYEMQTTFPMDFSIADAFGIKAIKDTYNRAFKEWKKDCVYLTELVITLNLKCWEHYHKGNSEISELYSDLFYKTQDYAYNHLKDDELSFFIETTD